MPVLPDPAHVAGDLSVLGLSAVQQAVFTSVLGEHRATVDHVAGHLRLDSAEVRSILDGLQEAGLVTRAANEADIYLVLDPRETLNAAANQITDAVAALRVRIPGYGARYDEIRNLAEVSPGPRDGSFIVVDTAETAGWYARLQQRAQQEFLVFDRPPYVSSPVEPLEGASIRRGVQVRAIYVAESFERPGAWEEVLRLADLGELSRTTPSLPVKMAIADRSSLLMSLTVRGPQVEVLLTRAPNVVTMMVELFERYWERATVLSASEAAPVRNTRTTPRETRPDFPVLNSRDQPLVALIGSGATDESIAQHLGISTRSVRRRTQALMRILGAETRFQFGMLCTRAGWL